MRKLIRPILDISMLVIFLALMAHTFFSGVFHECIGIGVAASVAAHVWLSVRKTRGEQRRERSLYRLACRAVELLVAVFLILVILTGVSLARDLFALSPAPIRPSLARPLHKIFSHGLFLLAGVHVGLRLPVLLAFLKVSRKSHRFKPLVRAILYSTLAILAVYGLVAAIRRGYFTIELSSNLMAFANVEEPIAFFFFDLVSIFIWASLCGVVLRHASRKLEHFYRKKG